MKLSGKKRTVDGSMSTKVKKSFSLSRKSLEYLRSTAKRNHARSESEALDQILEAARKREQREQYKAEMIAYYDSLTDEQMAKLEQSSQKFDARRRALNVEERSERQALRAELLAGDAANQDRVALPVGRARAGRRLAGPA